MKIGGWKTREVFGRYNIVSRFDIKEASSRIEEGRRQSAAKLTKPSATMYATDQNGDSKIHVAKAS